MVKATHSMLWTLGLAVPTLAWPVSEFGPSGSYAPITTTCPSQHTYVRSASSGLNPLESAWRCVRLKQVIPALEVYLKQNPIPGFDLESYISAVWNETSYAPILAMTFSGGGWRSAYPGLGLFEALDGRVQRSVEAGTGGLFQAMMYQGGLSGGTIATGLLGILGYPLLADLISNNNLNGTTNETSYDELVYKAKAGFNLTAADLLGASSVPNTLVNPAQPDVDPMAYTWSGIQVLESFKNGSLPMPYLVDAEVVPPGLEGSSSVSVEGPFFNGSILVPSDPTLVEYEFTPFEYGSWVGRVQGFADMHYMGTVMNNGSPANTSACVEGYDTAVYIVGSAEDSFSDWTAIQESGGVDNAFVKRSLPGYSTRPYPPDYAELYEQDQLGATFGDVSGLSAIIKEINGTLEEYFYAKISNPFRNWNEVGEQVASQEDLWLVDGGEGGVESPYFPVIQPARGVDFIIASDAAGSELPNGWANGTTLVNAAKLAGLAGLPFPSVPTSSNTMLNLGYTTQPVFFGCNDSPDVPLLLFAADYPYSAYTNISALGNNGRTPDQVAMLTGNTLPLISQQGFRDNWNECLACGAIMRSLQRMGQELPDRCKECMSLYCWNGTEVDTQPGYLDPSLALNATLSWQEWNSTIYN